MRLDLTPAKWIWLPSQRTLANTVILFRKTVRVNGAPKVARGWIAADSRYRLWVNGRRVQWGPAPHDPRHAEADPLDLAEYLQVGENVIAVEVLFFGHGEGTWPCGKPGLLFSLDIDGRHVLSDESWRCGIDRSRPAGGYRRWYLRSLQEIVDFRRVPQGWTDVGFDDSSWLNAQDLQVPASRAAYSGGYKEYATETWMTRPLESTLSARSIPMMTERLVPASRLRVRGDVAWRREPNDWFENRVPGCFDIDTQLVDEPVSERRIPGGGTRMLTYEWDRERVGFPIVEVSAPVGTVIDIMVQESHDPETSPWLDSHHFQWSRVTCGPGVTRFETFDYEAFRWLSLHVRALDEDAVVHTVAVRERAMTWPHEAHVETDDPKLQAVWEAALNTLDHSCQDIVVDGMGRERQQYSGDGAHQLHAARLARGDTQLSARFLKTFGQGQFLNGVYSDSWPAADRLMRLWERQVDGSDWGPIIDHSIGFIFDHFHHWMQTGDLEPFREDRSGLLRFAEFLRREAEAGDGLLRAERKDECAVWLDHDAFASQAHRRCALNLYASAAMTHALAPMLEALDEEASLWRDFGETLLGVCVARYWDGHLFVGGREVGDDKLDDRALATSVIFDQCPNGAFGAAVDLLSLDGDEIGRSYPANRVWRHWALMRHGRIQPIIDELRTRWAEMRSVHEAKSLQEVWVTRSDSTDLMSHCPQAPLILLHQGILGLSPLTPGYESYEIRLRLGDIRRLETTAYPPIGPVRLKVTPDEFELTASRRGEGVLFWDGERIALTPGETISRPRRSPRTI